MSTPAPPADEGLAPLTVSALNRAVAGSLARAFALVRVRGELASFTRAASGHWYFALKDSGAQVRCVMFRGRNLLVDFPPREGDALVATARVGLYEPRGDFQLTVESLSRDGQGRLFEEFLRRKARLEAEGLFDAARRRPLPALPLAVGVVTSLQAAALRDVVTTLARRAPQVRLIVYPVPVQGAEAAERIAQMLQRVNARDEVQSILLVRGGGSIEDLWAFNEEVLVRAVAASRLPIVVGVGHESDFTLADFAADVRAATPTAAAELVAPDRAGLLREITRQVQRATHAAGRPAQRAAQRLDYAIRSLLAPRAPLRGLDERIAQLRARAAGSAWRLLERATTGRTAAQRALLGARPTLDHRRLGLQSLQGRAAVALRERLQQTAARLHAAGRALETLDPHAVLRRGYSLVTDVAARVVTSAGQAPVGAVLEVRFAHGTARVDVLVSRPEVDP